VNRRRILKYGPWLVMWLIAPVAGFLLTYFVLTGAASLADKGPSQVAPAASSGEMAGNMSLAEAQAFDGYPVYWVGEEFEGLGVTHINRLYYEHPLGVPLPPSDMITVVYGNCNVQGTPPTCVPPISITTSSYCSRPQEFTAEAAKQGEPFTVRSATAEWVSNSLVIYAGDATVNIIAATDNPRDDAMRVGDSLRSMNTLGVTTGAEAFPKAGTTCGVSAGWENEEKQ